MPVLEDEEIDTWHENGHENGGHNGNGHKPRPPKPPRPDECEEYDPCKCAPGNDKEIVFNRNTCLSTDNRFIWDYDQGLLSIDGRISTSGSISSGAQVECAYLAPKALGLGSFNFTPPAGYGGFVYRGGSIFYYWNDQLNAWRTINLDPAEDVINVEHNGVLVWTGPTLNFIDSVSVSWAMSPNGELGIEAFGTGGGYWIADVDANGHCIKNLGCIQGAPGFYITNIANLIGGPTFDITNVTSINDIPFGDFVLNPMVKDLDANGFCINNLACINGIPIGDFLTNVWNQNVDASNHNLYNVNDLYVNGTFYYHGKPIEQWLEENNLWTLNPDGSISRYSDVHIVGPGSSPLTITSTGPTNYLVLNATDGSGAWDGVKAEVNGTYIGELGFSADTVELWSKDYLGLRVYGKNNACTPGSGFVYFPGRMGVNVLCPQYMLDVGGDARVSGCVYVGSHPASLCADSLGNFQFSGNISVPGSITSGSVVTGNVIASGSVSAVLDISAGRNLIAGNCVLIGSYPVSLCADAAGNLTINAKTVKMPAVEWNSYTPTVWSGNLIPIPGDPINYVFTGRYSVMGSWMVLSFGIQINLQGYDQSHIYISLPPGYSINLDGIGMVFTCYFYNAPGLIPLIADLQYTPLGHVVRIQTSGSTVSTLMQMSLQGILEVT